MTYRRAFTTPRHGVMKDGTIRYRASKFAAIDADMRRMTRASDACRRLMTIPGVGQLTALAFVAAIDDPSRIADPEISAPTWASSRGAISRVRSITSAASRNAEIDGCERFSMRPPTSC